MDWLLAYPSVVRWLFERGVRYFKSCNKSSSVEVPSVGDSGLEILHGGVGGDVE